MRLEQDVNGIRLYINFPVKEILAKILKYRKYWEEEYTQEVYNDYEDVYIDDPQLVAKDIDSLIEKINYYQTPDGINELFSLLPLKKNNKLSKIKKPELVTLNYGCYIVECYGWATQQLRIVVKNELEAEVCLDDIIVHY